jgi:hydrogenase 3 maturation protease
MIAGSTAPENFTGQIKSFQPDILFIVDAAFLGLPPGETAVIPQGEIGGLSCSTHMLPLPVLLQYLDSEVSCSMVLIGIQPRDTTLGLEMCEEVRESTKRLAQAFAQAGSVNSFSQIHG